MNSTTAMDNDHSVCRAGGDTRRIAKSPERWLRKLRHWKSMPNSQLLPTNRALFSCRKCRSTNVHGLICTWCGGPCDKAPGIQTPRRRVSAPHLLTDAQKEQLLLIEQKTATLFCSLSISRDGEVSDPRTVRRRRHRDAVVYSLDDATALVRTNRGTSVFVRSTFVAPDMDPAPLPPSQAPQLARLSGESSVEDGTEAGEHRSSLSCSPTRTLRRRKRFSLPKRMSSSRSLRDRMVDGAASILAFPKDRGDVLARTPELSVSQGRPGSPTRSTTSSQSSQRSRPLYSFIRKTIVSGNINGVPPSLRSASPSECSVIGTKARSVSPLTVLCTMDEGSDDSLPQSISPYVHVRSMSGCSVSGETELRMALSRGRRNTVTGTPEYVFRERPERQGTSLMLKVKKIRQGFKSLVMSRA